MNNSIKPLMFVLVILSCLLYAFPIIYAGLLSLGKVTGTLDPYLYNAVIIIGGILSTNLGAVFGTSFVPPATPAGDKTRPKYLGLRSSLPSDPSEPTADFSQKFQVIACWVYVGGLVTAFIVQIIGIVWPVKNVVTEPLIVELAKTLLGVMVGALTVALGKAAPATSGEPLKRSGEGLTGSFNRGRSRGVTAVAPEEALEDLDCLPVTRIVLITYTLTTSAGVTVTGLTIGNTNADLAEDQTPGDPHKFTNAAKPFKGGAGGRGITVVVRAQGKVGDTWALNISVDGKAISSNPIIGTVKPGGSSMDHNQCQAI